MSETSAAEQAMSSEIAEVKALLATHQREQGIYHCHNTLVQHVETVLNQYKDHAVEALRASKAFRDRMIVDLRAVSLVLTMVGNASTHKEKDARLRGSIELIESAITRLEREQFDISFAQGPHFDDVFRSDYPTRHYVERIKDLQAQLEECRAVTTTESAKSTERGSGHE